MTNMIVGHMVGHETILEKFRINAFFSFSARGWNIMRCHLASSV